MTATPDEALAALEERQTLELAFDSNSTCFITQNESCWLVLHHQGNEMRPSVYHDAKDVNRFMQDIAADGRQPEMTLINAQGKRQSLSLSSNSVENGRRPQAVVVAHRNGVPATPPEKSVNPDPEPGPNTTKRKNS